VVSLITAELQNVQRTAMLTFNFLVARKKNIHSNIYKNMKQLIFIFHFLIFFQTTI